MFSHSQAPVEGPRLQGARRQGREIQIGFVLTGIIPEGSNYPNVHTFWCQSARVSWNIYCRNTTLWITQPLYQLPDFLKSCKNFKMSCLEFWTHSFIHSFHWRVQSAMIPCRSQELLPFLSVMYFFLPSFSTNYSSIPSHVILLSVFWSASQSCCSKIHI